MNEDGAGHVPVTYDSCSHITGPFFHGTKSVLKVGDELVAGRRSNFHEGRVMNHIYFTALVDTAAWGAELATALAGSDDRGRIYVVEPLGPFEDDPNVTNKRFPGNPTHSYRTTEPLRVVEEITGWERPPAEMIRHMRERMAELAELGIEAMDD